MDSPEKALSKVWEAAEALIRLDGTKPSDVPETAGSATHHSSCQQCLHIGSAAFHDAACGPEVKVVTGDRIAVPLPLSPGIGRLRTAMLSGALVAALGFAGGWFARTYVSQVGNNGSSGLGTPARPPGVNNSTGSRGEIRTVNRELPIEGRALLDTIAGSESMYPGRDPYKTIYGGLVAETLADHPRQYVQIVAGPNTGQKTSAAGRYQYLERSWDEASKVLGLKDFSPASQDKAAFWDAQRTYRANTGRDLIIDIREANEDPQKLALIGRGISSWWTSLPGGIEPNNATSSFGDRFAENLSYYKNFTQPIPPSNPTDSANATARGAPSSLAPAAPLPNSSTPANKQATPDASHLPDSNAKETIEAAATAFSPATTKPNRAQDRAATRFRTANAMASPTRQISASQASIAAHRAERLTGRFVEPETRLTTIDGWTVRDVISGIAVLEGPDGIRNVALGEALPGLGKVDSIVRWGNRWIVSTERGLIAAP